MLMCQSFFLSFVGHERLINAMALTSCTMNVFRLIAPTKADMLVAVINVGFFYLVAMSFTSR